jgi:hypothetical protein
MLQSIGAQLKPEIKDNLAMSYMILQKHHCVLSYTKTTIDAIKHTFFFFVFAADPFPPTGDSGCDKQAGTFVVQSSCAAAGPRHLRRNVPDICSNIPPPGLEPGSLG